MTADPVRHLRADLQALDRAYTLGHHGGWAARRRADLVDEALVQLWARAAAPPGMALAALGGFGRRLQLPRSDIDLLVVHDDAVAPDDVARVADALLYPLWDAGFAVGHAVRTPGECLAAAEDRFDAWTAMIDGRPLAGDPALVEASFAPVRALAARDPSGFVARIEQAWVARRERHGSCAHLLEPDLKDGTGGLRDVASLGWLATALGGPLVDAGLLTAREAEAVDAAQEFLVRARSGVHLATRTRSDRLVVDLQPEVAAGFGFEDRPGLVATDGLMRTLFEHARSVEAALGSALGRFGVVVAPHPAPAGPAAVLELLADVAEQGITPTVGLLDAVGKAPLPDRVRWDEPTRAAFLRLLRTGDAGAEMLDQLDRADLLRRYLPVWADVRCRPQRESYHRFTVDAHLTATVARMAALVRAPDDTDPIHDEIVNQVDHLDAVLLGALLHDIGKVGAGAHVPIGARLAAAQLDAMGLDTETRDLAAFMVTEHLLLPDTATRRDLTDENLILDVAATIATPERLAALYLLAKADAWATGPAAWTPWRQALVRELVAKVQHVLDRGEMGTELAATLAERIGRVRDLLTDVADAEVDRFVLRMPRGYFLSAEPERAAAHMRTITPTLGSTEVRTATAAGAGPGTYELLVVAADRPGLLSWIAGSLAVGGISILSAQVFTTDDGVAVDLFEVEGAFEPEITEARWRAFRSTLRRTIEGAISLERRVEETRRHYPPPRVHTPLTVRPDDDASDFSTVIEVGAPDRIGLLYDITRTFADLKLDVRLAKVATFDGRVVDAFYVRDPVGRKITDPAQLAEIEQAVRARLG